MATASRRIKRTPVSATRGSGVAEQPTQAETVADLLARLGGVPARRVRLHPTPGTATERDVIEIHDRERRVFELVEGVLVEKEMGYEESLAAMCLARFLFRFLDAHDLGQLVGEQAFLRLFPGFVRHPDLLFVSWARKPRGRNRKAVPDLAPDLAVEVLSKGNTKKEIERKLDEYFRAGVRLVWVVDPGKRTVRVYTSATESELLSESDTLEGGDVLPGFRLAIRDWFAEVDRVEPH